MDFENLRKTWNSFGQSDPLWSILAWEGKAGNKWDLREFFEVGEGEIAYILTEAEKRKEITIKQKSLDFGCGVGRLTFPLSKYFAESHGVDISEAMIALAQKFKSAMEMYGKRKEELIKFIEQRKGKVLDVVEDLSCGIELKSYRYFVTK